MNLLKTILFAALAVSVAQAQDAKDKVKKPAKLPAKSAPKSTGASKGGATTAGRGPTTAGRGPTTAGRGPTTAGRGTPAAGRGTPARGGAPAGRAPAGRAVAGGRAVPKGSHVTRTAHGDEVVRRANGRPADVRVANRGMAIHHGLNGSRRIAVDRPDHSRIVADRRGYGYVQHPYSYRGHEFAHRTYYRDGRAYDRFYRPYSYHGVMVEGYAPAVYFAPAFYGWVYNPWARPITFGWGFAAAPWYGAYGFYFTPFPVYASASLWLTDYIISQQLAAAYAAQQAAAAAGPPPAGAVPLTPEVKDQIAAEVQRQIALENQEGQQTAQQQDIDPANSGIGRELSDGQPHVFVAGASLDVVDSTGAECAVSQGDALQLVGPPPGDATAASLIVLASKGGQECAKGATVSVNFQDLQDMENSMRETIDQGMADLQSKQGQNGLPAAPASAQAPPQQADFAKQAPPPDPDVANQVNQQVAAADQAEQQVLAEAPAGGPADGSAAAPAAVPTTIALGQSIDEVVAALGQPKNIVDLGAKKIYVYADMKITFNDGKVTDVQ